MSPLGVGLWKTQARLGIARLGATRLGGFSLLLSITINDANVATEIESLSITQAINDEADTGTLTTLPSPSFTPSNGMTVSIGFGGVYREFGGQIANVSTELLNGSEPVYTITLKDWQRLFDRRLVSRTYEAMSASDIALDIISGAEGFTARVEGNLPTIEFLPLVNQYRSQALAQLVTLIGGGYVITADRKVLLWGAGGRASVDTTSPPLQLVVGLATLQTLQHQVTSDQIRTRVYVEGKRTTCPIPISRTAFPSLVNGFYEIPVASADPFPVIEGVQVQYLVVAGGGGGGTYGGGGGGGVRSGTTTIGPGSFPVVVGAGGGVHTTGGNSSFNALIAQGGGRGGNGNESGASGGSGGGGGWGRGGGSGVSEQGRSGGDGSDLECDDADDTRSGGGGGGAGSSGDRGDGVHPGCSLGGEDGGDAGDGVSSSITGTAVYYGSGGPGDSDFGSAGDAGLGGPSDGQDGVANTGAGGSDQRSGGSGKVVVRYLTGALTATGGTMTTDGGDTIHSFNSSSTLVVSGSAVAMSVRIGTDRVASAGLGFQPDFNNPSTVTEDEAAAGDTSIQVAATTGAVSWAKIGDQYIYFGATATGPVRLMNIPASGPGAITGPITSGAQVTFLSVLTGIVPGSFESDQPEGSEVVIYAQVDDPFAQNTLAAREGGDGIHEYVISDTNLDVNTMLTRGEEELANYARDLHVLSWTTRDMNARPGQLQEILLPTIGVSLILTITRATVTFDVTDRREPPFRSCEASVVPIRRLLDTVAGKRGE